MSPGSVSERRQRVPVIQLLPLRFGYSAQDLVFDDDSGVALFPGELVSLRGANMSGKSTLVRLLVGLIGSRAIHVNVKGNSVANWNLEAAGNAEIRAVHQNDPLFLPLTVWENLLLGSSGRRDMHERARQVRQLASDSLQELGAQEGDLLDTPLGKLSGGGVSIVRLLRAVAWGYRVLLLDEPTTGLDPARKQLLRSRIRDSISGYDICILLVSFDDEDHGWLSTLAKEKGLKYREVSIQGKHLIE